jgi:uncharacterized repeat protein (TIGR01451 family)
VGKRNGFSFSRWRKGIAMLTLLLAASTASAQAVVYDHGSSATAFGAGASGTPTLSFNVTAGQNRILFITAAFERDHCQTNTTEVSSTCTTNDFATGIANNNFAAPSFVTNNGVNMQIQFTLTGPGGSITVTNPLSSPNGDLRFNNLYIGFSASTATYSQESYFTAIYESQLRTLLGGAASGTITVTLPNVDAPNRAGDEALLAGVQFDNVNQLASGAAGTGIVRSLVSGVGTDCNTGLTYSIGAAPFNWSICPSPASYDAGQAPATANDGVLLFGFNGFSRAAPDGFAASPGFTVKMSPDVINTDPSTSGTAGAHFLESTESDGFSTTFQFTNGTPSAATVKLQSQNGGLTSGALTTGGMMAGFTVTAATLDLAITKTDNINITTPGATNTYTVVVTNNSTVNYGDGATVTDPAASNLAKTGVSCTASGGAVCPVGVTVAQLESGVAIPTLPPSSTVTFTVTATVSAAATGTVTNTATVATPTGYTDSNSANNTASDTDTIQPGFGTCDSRMWLSQGSPSTQLTSIDTTTNPFTFTAVGAAAAVQYNALAYNPGDNYLYAILQTSSNHLLRIGSDGSTIDLGAVTGLPSATYISGAFGAANTMYVLNNSLPTSALYVINTTTLTATTVTLSRGVSIGDIAYIGGLLYSVEQNGQLISINPTTGAVTNIGATNGISNGTFFGALMGAPNGLWGSLNTGGFYKIDLVTGAITLVAGTPASNSNDGANCPNANITFGSDLSITKTDGKANYTPGGTNTYTIVVTNNGPFGAANAVFTDPAIANLTVTSVTCASPTGGATCPTAANTTVALMQGSGIVIPSLPYSNSTASSVTFTVTGTVAASSTGSLTNVATVAAGAGTTETNNANNTATDTDASLPQVIMVKTLTGGAAVPNTFNFSLTGVTNTSDTAANVANGATVTSATLHVGAIGTAVTITETSATSPALSGYLTGVSCTDANAPGDGNSTVPITSATTGVTIPATNMLANAAWTCRYTNTATANVSIAKTDNTPTYSPGGTATYTLTVTNAATATATVTGATVSDLLPTGLTIAAPGITCTPIGTGTSCAGSGSAVGTAGTGALDVLSGLSLILPPGGTVTIAIPVAYGSSPASY